MTHRYDLWHITQKEFIKLIDKLLIFLCTWVKRLLSSALASMKTHTMELMLNPDLF